METMSKYFSKKDLLRKKSEDWAREKEKEWVDADSVLTFAEWCYQQGKADEREKAIEKIHSFFVDEMNKLETDSDDDFEYFKDNKKVDELLSMNKRLCRKIME